MVIVVACNKLLKKTKSVSLLFFRLEYTTQLLKSEQILNNIKTILLKLLKYQTWLNMFDVL